MLRERAFRERETSFEAFIEWYVFDLATSVKDDLYDEASVTGEKRFAKKAHVPILWWFDEEGGDRLTAEGRVLTRSATMAVTVGALRNAGIDPESDDRVNDMVKFRGWFWGVENIVFTSQSSLMDSDTDDQGDDATARVSLLRRFPISDMPYDFFPDPEEP